jgi:pimeloyl-ACP methyl ester carboxylesterase
MLSREDYIEGRLVKFTATDKVRLHGFLFGKARGGRCLIYVHGMNGNFYSSGIGKAVSSAAASNGYAAFMINTRGHDIESSSHTVSGRKSKRVVTGTKIEKFEDSIYDIGGAIRAMKKAGYRKFVLVGHSTGCQKILFYQYKKKDKSVKALVMLAPDDDYHLNKKSLGKRWKSALKQARKHRKDTSIAINPYGIPYYPQRFISVADLNYVESRIFNYDGEMKEFSKVRTPTFVVFGTKDEGAIKPVEEYMKILERKSRARIFGTLVIQGANHSFRDYEDSVAFEVVRWASNTVK